MAISSPYVGQTQNKNDPFEKGMAFGAQLGSQMCRRMPRLAQIYFLEMILI